MTQRKALDARALMQRAVDAMRSSVDEPRADGKSCPKVGAVLWMPDGTTVSAHRGELRYGDHAEFTLLERKLRDRALDGATLFATLEPCAPGARSAPKLGCAERIVLARIARVWVGIEDPDPLIARKGIQHLLDSGVEVRMFDSDLQQEIQEINKSFLGQALDRAAAAAEEAPKEVTLYQLEERVANAKLDDLSQPALNSYGAAAESLADVGSAPFNRGLARLGLLAEEGGVFVPTGFGFLLFGREPRTAMPQAGLLGTIHYPDGAQEVRDFDGPQVDVPEQAIGWLRDKLPNPIDRTAAKRRDANARLFLLVREGIVNALVHRDYTIRGAKCQLVVTPEKIVVKSPGRPVEPITLDQMQSFNAPMLSRNPALHYVFARMKLAEERGLGLRSMRDAATDAALPPPTYAWEDPYLVLTLYRSAAGAADEIARTGLDRIKPEDREALEFLVTMAVATRKEFAEAMGVDNRKAQRQLKRLIDAGFIYTKGAGPATRYVVATPDRDGNRVKVSR